MEGCRLSSASRAKGAAAVLVRGSVAVPKLASCHFNECGGGGLVLAGGAHATRAVRRRACGYVARTAKAVEALAAAHMSANASSDAHPVARAVIKFPTTAHGGGGIDCFYGGCSKKEEGRNQSRPGFDVARPVHPAPPHSRGHSTDSDDHRIASVQRSSLI